MNLYSKKKDNRPKLVSSWYAASSKWNVIDEQGMVVLMMNESQPTHRKCLTWLYWKGWVVLSKWRRRLLRF